MSKAVLCLSLLALSAMGFGALPSLGPPPTIPADVVWTCPNAFSVFTISDADVTDNFTTLVHSVARGDVLFFRGWFDSTENAQVRQIYQQALSGTD